MDEKEALRALLEASRMVQSNANQNQQVTLAVLNTFLGAALLSSDKRDTDPHTLEDLATLVGVPPSTISLHMRYLGDKYREEDDGMNLVLTEIFPLNRRKKSFRLTPKGRTLAQQIAYIIGRTPNASQAAR